MHLVTNISAFDSTKTYYTLSDSRYTRQEGITEFAENTTYYTFEDKIQMPRITSIPTYMFAYSENIVNFNMPTTVYHVGVRAFEHVDKLANTAYDYTIKFTDIPDPDGNITSKMSVNMQLLLI